MYLFTNEKVIITKRSHVHGDIKELVGEAVKQIEGGETFIKKTIDFGYEIGVTKCVKTTDDDTIYLHQRKGRRLPSRMVANRKAEPSSKLTVILLKRNDGEYSVITTFVGDCSEPEVWDENAFQKSDNYELAKQRSLDFWSNHALIK